MGNKVELGRGGKKNMVKTYCLKFKTLKELIEKRKKEERVSANSQTPKLSSVR